MSDKPDNILRYGPPLDGFEIHQWHAVYEEIHDHVERPVQGDGWTSVVVDPDGRKVGPFAFTGEAVAKMRQLAAERSVHQSDRSAESEVSATGE